LVKTWAMRGTLHVLAPEEAGAYLSLVGALRVWETARWQRAFGVTPTDMDAIVEVVSDVLDGHVLTREQLIEAIVARTGGRHLEQPLRSGWGAVLKPLAWMGHLCHGPNQGNRVTFTRPDAWLPGWRGIDEPADAARIAIPRYLGAHGPATIATFDRWLTRGQSRKGELRSWFEALGDRLATIEVEGESCFALADDLDELTATLPSETVRLLPAFDQFVLGAGTADARIVPAARRSLVSKAAGWISPVVIAGGRVVGVWEIDGEQLKIRLFAEATPIDSSLLEAEAARVATIVGQELRVSVGTTDSLDA
jgi:hypothetical protein